MTWLFPGYHGHGKPIDVAILQKTMADGSDGIAIRPWPNRFHSPPNFKLRHGIENPGFWRLWVSDRPS
jgi:hypothetical protein